VADHEQGLASGLLNTSFQVGGAVGLAVVTAVVRDGSGGVPSVGEFQSAIVVSLALAVAAVLVAATGLVAPVRERVLARAET
jgi:hypothetical protein